MKRFLIAAALGAASVFCAQAEQHFSSAGFYAVDGSPRTVSDFNPGWRFSKGEIAGAEKADFDDSGWEAANLPHGLEILGENASGGRNYQGVAWYRKKFPVKKENKQDRVFLYFEAVMGEAHVWVNGKKVAEHFGGYLPFAADITDVIHPDGQLNVVAVKADNSDSTLYPPGKNQSGLDFTYLGGIYRDTYLIQTSPVHVTLRELSKTAAGGGIFIATLDIEGQNAKMEVRTEVQNSSDRDLNITVKSTLKNTDGKTVGGTEESLQLKGGEIKQLAKPFEVKNAHFWHPDDPYLHFLQTDIYVGGKLVDSLKTRVGIRLFEMRGPDGLFVNKKYIGRPLVGANRHQDYHYVGNALPNSGQWRDVKLLREGGCGVIRAGHYPLDSAFYDACDEFGMLVTTANPGWHFYNFKEKVFEERLYDDTRQLVRRDRNVASILLWETAINETPYQPDYAMNTMHKIAHEEFPFPGMYTVADFEEAKKGGLDMFYNNNDGKVNSFNREYGDGGEVDDWYSQNARQRIKMEWGEGPLLQQAMIQADHLNWAYNEDKLRIGSTLWCGIDHHRGYHPDPFRGGLLNGFRIPRYGYYLYQSQIDPDYEIPGIGKKPMIYITHELTQVSDKDIIIFSNCDEIKLTWMGKEIGTQKPSNEGQYKYLPHPPFVFKDVFNFKDLRKVGKKERNSDLVAEGFIGGKLAVTEIKKYPERTTRIELSLSGEGMDLAADGSDFIPVRATVVDQNGVKKVLASEYVYFEVEGPAEIIGDSSTFANPMKTSFGVATALIRSTTVPGKIKVTAHSAGLGSGSITFESVSAKLPFAMDEQYAANSRKPEKAQAVIITAAADDSLPADVKVLKDEVKQLQLELVGKEQDIMELQSRLGEHGN